MKNIIYIALLAILTLGAGLFLPQWWFVAFIGFVLALYFRPSIGKAALITFVIVTMVWFVSAFQIDMNNESILSLRVGGLLGGIGPMALTLLSAIVGGITGALGAMTGASLSTAIRRV